MTDPVYTFVKGRGWVPTLGLLPVETYLGNWWQRKPGWWYPEVYKCARFLNINGRELQPGDCIPLGNEIYIIREKPVGGYGSIYKLFQDGPTVSESDNYYLGGVWEGVARL